MAEFSVTVNTLQKNGFDFGMTDYPIFDEAYRNQLNIKILNHFKFCEIGYEVEELFYHYFNMQLAEIMPYYNQLYKSELYEFDFLHNIALTDTQSRTILGDQRNTGELTNNIAAITDSTDSKTSTTSGETHNQTVNSDTPQGLLSMPDIKGNIYATDVSIADAQGTSEQKESNIQHGSSSQQSNSENKAITDFKTVDDYIKKLVGTDGRKYPTELLTELRGTFLNIDMMVINDLKICFMQIYQ